MSNLNRKSEKKNIRFEHKMIDDIAKVSGNFSAFVKQAVREKLEREKGQ